jgi:fluoroquinolone transport system ATP-binding protein
MLDIPGNDDNIRSWSTNMIQVENLTFTYTSGDSPAVRHLDFEIQQGEIFGFLGPSGAGKSTTQKILIRLLRAFDGSVIALGRDLRSWGYDLYERIGVSFELPNHYSKLTGVENLKYFGSLYRGDVADALSLLEMVGLEEDGEMLVSQYSKGMKNRLNVARSLIHNPELLFLDEPTAGLDPVNSRRIKELIKAQRDAGKTIFLTTHDMTVADELCDRIAFIVDGKISLVDSPSELKLRYGKPEVRVEFQANDQSEFMDFPLQDLADNSDFYALLREKRIRTIHTLEATLETIFIEVTGRSLL